MENDEPSHRPDFAEQLARARQRISTSGRYIRRLAQRLDQQIEESKRQQAASRGQEAATGRSPSFAVNHDLAREVGPKAARHDSYRREVYHDAESRATEAAPISDDDVFMEDPVDTPEEPPG